MKKFLIKILYFLEDNFFFYKLVHFRQAHPEFYVPTDVLQECLINDKKIVKHELSHLDAYQGNLLATCTVTPLTICVSLYAIINEYFFEVE